MNSILPSDRKITCFFEHVNGVERLAGSGVRASGQSNMECYGPSTTGGKCIKGKEEENK